MKILDLEQIRNVLNFREVIERMRDALIAQSRGDCDTPMPMHLDIAAEQAEVHMKSSYRRGGPYFALKMASTFPGNIARGLPTGSGAMLLCSAETGDVVALLADGGHLTDVRTAAVSAMAARELGRKDRVLGILGTGIQARLQARMHREILDLERVWVWGRTRERAEECARDLRLLLPGVEVAVAASPAAVAREARLIVTATAARAPLLALRELQAETHISAVGADAAGKQELHAGVLKAASLLLADSRRQCEMLGELQHAPGEWERVRELGAYCESGAAWDGGGISVCDFTGVGVEDLFVAAYCYEKTR